MEKPIENSPEIRPGDIDLCVFVFGGQGGRPAVGVGLNLGELRASELRCWGLGSGCSGRGGMGTVAPVIVPVKSSLCGWGIKKPRGG